MPGDMETLTVRQYLDCIEFMREATAPAKER